MKNRPRLGMFHKREVKSCFGTGSSVARRDMAVFIHLNQDLWTNRRLVDSAGCHQQSQRRVLQHHAEIATGSFTPSPAMKVPNGVHEPLVGVLRVGQRC